MEEKKLPRSIDTAKFNELMDDLEQKCNECFFGAQVTFGAALTSAFIDPEGINAVTDNDFVNCIRYAIDFGYYSGRRQQMEVIRNQVYEYAMNEEDVMCEA